MQPAGIEFWLQSGGELSGAVGETVHFNPARPEVWIVSVITQNNLQERGSAVAPFASL